MDLLEHPRYKDRPMYLFFEKYITEVVGELPPEKSDIIQNMRLDEVFGVEAETWQDVVRQALRLSPTLDIAIVDRWFDYLEEAADAGREPEADGFARQFVDAYFADNSDIDVWADGELDAAIERIKARRTQNETA